MLESSTFKLLFEDNKKEFYDYRSAKGRPRKLINFRAAGEKWREIEKVCSRG